jgi:arsenate reductase
LKRVLFVCTGNKARSQMAEGLLRHLGGDRFEAHSAGTRPSGLAEETVAAMREIGIDVSSQRSKHVDEFAGQEFDYVITVCDSARQECPVFPGDGKRLHWDVEDPADTEGVAPRECRRFGWRGKRSEGTSRGSSEKNGLRCSGSAGPARRIRCPRAG